MATTYTTRDEAIQREIVEPIEATGEAKASEYDIDTIADEVLGSYENGYAVKVTEDGFWESVAANAR